MLSTLTTEPSSGMRSVSLTVCATGGDGDGRGKKTGLSRWDTGRGTFGRHFLNKAHTEFARERNCLC